MIEHDVSGPPADVGGSRVGLWMRLRMFELKDAFRGVEFATEGAGRWEINGGMASEMLPPASLVLCRCLMFASEVF